ncbi:uncharacterized protein TrAFT101_011844 [Trichoderma asperellum]|uniref:uncharacterized protein n=1 Tax=Trichoderma asperellum TaxID=101201 RepID=UPI0033337094|nr:hypothetical protein TrAFT101_011844 [Trichoderma asperellum]
MVADVCLVIAPASAMYVICAPHHLKFRASPISSLGRGAILGTYLFSCLLRLAPSDRGEENDTTNRRIARPYEQNHTIQINNTYHTVQPQSDRPHESGVVPALMMETFAE